MVASVEDRVTSLELELRELRGRVRRLEPRPPGPAPRPSPPLRTVPPAAGVSRDEPVLDLEELLGGRLLALAGGVAVLVGLAFLVALAVDRGWIGEWTRVSLAFAGSAALLGFGVWLFERRGKSQAALAMVGTAIGGLFLAVTAAGSLYGLVPDAVALAAALGVGALAATLAVRWSSQTIAGLGLGGALLAPVYASSSPTGDGIAFLALAFAASAAVLVWQRWEWLRVGAFAAATAQVALWPALTEVSTPTLVAGLSFFGLVGLALALGYELRVPDAGLRPSTSLLVATNALVLGGIGAVALYDALGERSAGAWMAALALVHVVLGLVVLRVRPAARPVGYLLLGVSLIAGDIAFGLLVDGAALAVGWAAGAIALAALARLAGEESELYPVTLAGQLSLAIGHTLLFHSDQTVTGAVPVPYGPLVAIAVSAFACARLARPNDVAWRFLADGTALVTVAYLTGAALDGVALVAAWGAQALALGQVARRTNDALANVGALVFLGLAAAHTLVFEARPAGLVHGVESLVAMALALAVVTGVAVRLAFARGPVERWIPASVAGGAAIYGASLAIVTVFQSGQQGQAALSAFWALCGLALLWTGLRLDHRIVRLYGFGLLSLAVAKVFLFDMSALQSGWRILSFVVLGLLLLAGAYAYQRMRGRGDEVAA
jgi:uncharacterized membrane protein